MKGKQRRYADAKWTREAIIAAFKRWKETYGRYPRSAEWHGKKIRGTYPNTRTVVNVFGSWNEALVAAGFPILKRAPVTSAQKYTEKEMLDALRAYPNGTPTVNHWGEEHRRPAVGVYIQRFGSWNAALEAAGLPTRAPKRAMVEVQTEQQEVEGVSEGKDEEREYASNAASIAAGLRDANQIGRLKAAIRAKMQEDGASLLEASQATGVGRSTIGDFLNGRIQSDTNTAYLPGYELRERLLKWVKGEPVDTHRRRARPRGYVAARNKLLAIARSGVSVIEVTRAAGLSEHVGYALRNGENLRRRTLAKLEPVLDQYVAKYVNVASERATATPPQLPQPSVPSMMQSRGLGPERSEERPANLEKPVVQPYLAEPKSATSDDYVKFLMQLAEKQAEHGNVDPSLLDRIERAMGR